MRIPTIFKTASTSTIFIPSTTTLINAGLNKHPQSTPMLLTSKVTTPPHPIFTHKPKPYNPTHSTIPKPPTYAQITQQYIKPQHTQPHGDTPPLVRHATKLLSNAVARDGVPPTHISHFPLPQSCLTMAPAFLSLAASLWSPLILTQASCMRSPND